MSAAPAEVDLPRSADNPVSDKPWVTIVWNDPVNLMSYVTYVFQHVFGYPKKKATKLMLDVHHKGKAVVAAGARERCRLARVDHVRGRLRAAFDEARETGLPPAEIETILREEWSRGQGQGAGDQPNGKGA